MLLLASCGKWQYEQESPFAQDPGPHYCVWHLWALALSFRGLDDTKLHDRGLRICTTSTIASGPWHTGHMYNIRGLVSADQGRRSSLGLRFALSLAYSGHAGQEPSFGSGVCCVIVTVTE